ncbi:MAG: outer membrane lipoprotein-sorting protein, partial [Verrucomicrobiaceae bacterium]|nr:outer membrane lipoprotein-sorting protein [Verrucomicrobiaceae bacterium]
MRFAILFAVLMPTLGLAQTKTFTARELIAGVKAARPSGSLYARLRMEHRGAQGETVLQVQMKRRQLPEGGSESLYQLLFPAERKGEGLLLKARRNAFTGATFVPGKGVRPLKSGDRDTAVFGTAVDVEDLLASFLNWPDSEIVGQAKEGNIPCTIVELRAPKGSASTFSRARCWIDEKRYATMRVEFFGSGDKPLKTVTTHKVMRGSSGFYSPVNFTVSDHTTGASTKVEGVRSDSDVSYSDADFSDDALQAVTPAPGK